MELGHRFHQMAQQLALGVSADVLALQAEVDADLARWWDNFLKQAPRDLPGKSYPEYMLSIPFEGRRLVAAFDLLKVDPGQSAWILDWKTSRRKSKRAVLQNRIQTRLYPFLLVEGGMALNGGQALQPEQVQMMYWYPELPEQPEIFAYSAAQHAANRTLFKGLIEEIKSLGDGPFPLTREENACRFCNYRSLCDRGRRAGRDDELEGEEVESSGPLSIDFEQIGEIEY
jgi:hypothetical protein